MVDEYRITWIRVFDVPCYAWTLKFFDFIAKPVRKMLYIDKVTKFGSKMDVARFLVRTNCANSINEVLFVNINGVRFRLKLEEDSYGSVSFLFFPESLEVEDVLSEAVVERGELGEGDDDVEKPFFDEFPLVDTRQVVASSTGKCDGELLNNLEKPSSGHAMSEKGAVKCPMDNLIRIVPAGLL